MKDETEGAGFGSSFLPHPSSFRERLGCRCDRVRFIGSPPTAVESYDPALDCPHCFAYHTRADFQRDRGGPGVALPVREEPCPPPDPEPLRVVRVDGSRLAGRPTTLTPQTGHSNASIVRWQGKLLMAYRYRNAGADVWVCELDPDTYQPLHPGHRLDLWHPLCVDAREDPWLFEFAGRLHVGFVGVAGKHADGVRWRTSVLYARLTDGLDVERVVYPDYAGRVWPQEKSWPMFEHEGQLYAVYSIRPHVVLRIDGDRGEKAYETPTPHAWSGGHLRGGAAPVRVGDQYVSWFHGALDRPGRPRAYSVGCYAFRAKPPFDVLRMSPTPVMWADPRDRLGYYCDVRFVRGAVLDGPTWVLSMGVQDRRIEVAEFDAQEVCRRLAGPSGKAPKRCGCR